MTGSSTPDGEGPSCNVLMASTGMQKQTLAWFMRWVVELGGSDVQETLAHGLPRVRAL